MMSRRRFLQITVSMAAAAAVSPFPTHALEPSDVRMGPDLWIPTVLEVAEWLEYYKLTVGMANRRFHEIIATLGTENDDAQVFIDEFSTAERDFDRMQSARREVTLMQGAGHHAGRTGQPRRNPAFLQRSHTGFGWYNYWAVGDYDRRRAEGLPRLGRTLEEEYRILREQGQAAPRLLPA